jgi:hypothetical protein
MHTGMKAIEDAKLLLFKCMQETMSKFVENIMKCSIKLFHVFNVANTCGSMMHLLDVHLHACKNLGCNQ